MRRTARMTVPALFMVLVALLAAGDCGAQLTGGKSAPVFTLKGLDGKTYDLAQAKDRPMVVLYFFDVDSRPSQEGLLTLNDLAKRHGEQDLSVWAVTSSPREKVSAFRASSGLTFPILLDGGEVGTLYQARLVLPTVAVIGPGLKILNYYQGGGKTTEVMLTGLAERQLQRRLTKYAQAVSDAVLKADPKSPKARAVKGYAALKEQNLKEAEQQFGDLAKSGGEAEVLGKEGLAAVHAKKDEPDKALQLIAEVQQKAPDRSYAHVIKGDILYAQNKKKEAEEQYQTAVKKKVAEPYQEGVRYNQLGRMYANAGKYQEARGLYDQAVTIDPYYIEGTTNKGLTYEREGKWDSALESYRQALTLDKNDHYAAVLAKKASEMLEIQKDIERKKRVDQLVKDLAQRYKAQKEAKAKGDEDAWTSQPMVLSFVDFQEKGGLSERDGFSTVLMSQLGDHLNASGRVKVVERVIIDRLLEELNLGSSELADPETALRLGRILAARLVGTGSLYYLPQGTLLSLRLIDTETTAIPQVTTRQMGPQAGLEKEIFGLNREILRTVISKYPLRGFVVKLSGDEAMINVGAKQGAVTGTKFDVLEEQGAVEYKGKQLRPAPKTVAQIEVSRVEPDFSYAKVVSAQRPLKADDKVEERMEEAALK